MLTNAEILQVVRPAAGVMGTPRYPATGAGTIPGPRCAVTAPTRRQQIMLGAVLKDVTAAVRVMLVELERRGLSIEAKDRIVVRIDRQNDVQTLDVVTETTTRKLGMDNQVLFCREAEVES